MRTRRPWTDDEIETVRINYADWPTFLIAYLVDRNESSVYNLAHKLGLRKSAKFYASKWANRWHGDHPNSVKHRFKPGQTPPNKGLRRPGWSRGRMATTQFKKGHKPKTWQPIGTEVRDAYGYVKRKIRDDAPRGQSRFNWKYVHVLLWEEHLGPVPPKHIIVFKNHDKTDIRIDNLACISKAENMRRNSYHNRYPKEIGRLIQLRGALVRTINRRTRNEPHRQRSARPPVRHHQRAARQGRPHADRPRKGDR